MHGDYICMHAAPSAPASPVASESALPTSVHQHPPQRATGNQLIICLPCGNQSFQSISSGMRIHMMHISCTVLNSFTFLLHLCVHRVITFLYSIWAHGVWELRHPLAHRRQLYTKLQVGIEYVMLCTMHVVLHMNNPNA